MYLNLLPQQSALKSQHLLGYYLACLKNLPINLHFNIQKKGSFICTSDLRETSTDTCFFILYYTAYLKSQTSTTVQRIYVLFNSIFGAHNFHMEKYEIAAIKKVLKP